MTMEKRNLNRAPGFKFQVFPSIYQCKTQQDAHYNFSSPWLCSTTFYDDESDLAWQNSQTNFYINYHNVCLKTTLTNSHYIQGYFF